MLISTGTHWLIDLSLSLPESNLSSCNVVLTFESVDEILNGMDATEQYFRVFLFIMLCKVVLTFESVHEFLKCGHSNENC